MKGGSIQDFSYLLLYKIVGQLMELSHPIQLLMNFLIADCFKKNFVQRMNNSCKMPWSNHLDEWREEFDVKGKLSGTCEDDDTREIFESEHFYLTFDIIRGENSTCKGLEFLFYNLEVLSIRK